MLNEKQIVADYKSGLSIAEIAKKHHVITYAISQIIKSKDLPNIRLIRKANTYPDFENWFKETYNSHSMKELKIIMRKHPVFESIKTVSLDKRINCFRKLYNLEPKLLERKYDSQYDRIRGYIIRNSKYMAKRRGIYFNLNYTDFELPEFCPILGIKLEYGSGSDGNSPQHATLDRIDNSKGYIPGNVMVVSRLANAMKNSASFEQIQSFSTNYNLLINYFNEHGTLGNITDIFPHWKKLSLDS